MGRSVNIRNPLKLHAFSGAIRPFPAVAWRKSLKLLGLCDALSRFGGDPGRLADASGGDPGRLAIRPPLALASAMRIA